MKRIKRYFDIDADDDDEDQVELIPRGGGGKPLQSWAGAPGSQRPATAVNVDVGSVARSLLDRLEDVGAQHARNVETERQLLAKRMVRESLIFSEDEQHARDRLAFLSLVPFAVSLSLVLLALLGQLEWAPRAFLTRFGVLLLAPLPLAAVVALFVSCSTSRATLPFITLLLALIELLVVYATVSAFGHIATAATPGALSAGTSLIALVAAVVLLVVQTIAGAVAVFAAWQLGSIARLRRPRGARHG